MKLVKTCMIFSLAIFLSGCYEAKYQNINDSFRSNSGFQQRQDKPNHYTIGFIGNSNTEKAQTYAFALRRAAEITIENGNSHFIVLRTKGNVLNRTVVGQYGTTPYTTPSTQLKIKIGSDEANMAREAAEDKKYLYDANKVMQLTSLYATTPETLSPRKEFTTSLKHKILLSAHGNDVMKKGAYYGYLREQGSNNNPKALEYIYHLVNTSHFSDGMNHVELGFLNAAKADLTVTKFIASKEYLPEATAMVAYVLKTSNDAESYKSFKKAYNVQDWMIDQAKEQFTNKKAYLDYGAKLYQKEG